MEIEKGYITQSEKYSKSHILYNRIEKVKKEKKKKRMAHRVLSRAFAVEAIEYSKRRYENNSKAL